MMYTKFIDVELNKLEKRFNLKIEDLHWVESLLFDVYTKGFEYGQATRNDKDYEQGYRDGKQDGVDESWSEQD